MAELDWHKVRFLESGSNLKPLLRTLTGRTPSTTLVREVGACLQQGRLFYTAAARAPLEIHPLLLYYGFVAFAKALVIGRTLRSLSTLTHAHGLSDTSMQGSRLRDLRMKVGAAGTFQEFNDVASEFSRVCYIGANLRPSAVPISSTRAKDLEGREWDLKTLLSRVPGVEDLYRMTFGEDSCTESMIITFWAENAAYCELRIDDREIFADRQHLRALVAKWRSRYPFLKQWRFVSGVPAWGKSVLEFANVSNQGIDEFGEAELEPSNRGFQSRKDVRGDVSIPRIPFHSILAPMAGGLSGGNAQAVAPLDGLYPSEFALHYLVLFLLASVVRYRPDTWSHAISRSIVADRPSDDEVVALLERFLEIHASEAVTLVVRALNAHEELHV